MRITFNVADIYHAFGIHGTPKRLPRKLKKRMKHCINRALRIAISELERQESAPVAETLEEKVLSRLEQET